jgi:hypothetical protein
MVQVDDDLTNAVDAMCVVDDCLAELVTSSLVSIDSNIHGWKGVHRCAPLPSAASRMPISSVLMHSARP